VEIKPLKRLCGVCGKKKVARKARLRGTLLTKKENASMEETKRDS
jgi:hypothetical protein